MCVCVHACMRAKECDMMTNYSQLLPIHVDGSRDLKALLDQLNQLSQTAVIVKSEILQTVLGVFQLDSIKKSVFREVCGFQCLISVLASLIGSLAPRRCHPWIDGERWTFAFEGANCNYVKDMGGGGGKY